MSKASKTETRTEWGVIPQAAIDRGNMGHVLSGVEACINNETQARAAVGRLGGIVCRREVTVTTDPWESVDFR